jgi:phosphoglycerate kinase
MAHMKLRSIRDAEIAGKTVLVRLDFNVPLDENGHVTDTTRISAALNTIAWLLEQGGNLVLCSHLGRPHGVEENLRLSDVANKLEPLLNAHLNPMGTYPVHVKKLSDCVGPDVKAYVEKSPPDEVILLENLRFNSGEEANDPEFTRQLAELAHIYCSDAFGTLHRAHASTEGVAHLLPAYAGFLVEKEVAALEKLLGQPDPPLTIVMGGAKISEKIEVIENLLPRADNLLIGGAMANTFLKAQGFNVGASRVEDDQLDTARRVMEQAGKHGVMLLTPVDVVVSDDIKSGDTAETRLHHEIQDGDIVADIGPRTAQSYAEVIAQSGTVFWNGPMGVFEQERFAAGTLAVAEAMAAASNAYTMVGGGESVEAVNQAGVAEQISHISTGGGASLEFLGGRDLPGLKVLQDQ